MKKIISHIIIIIIFNDWLRLERHTWQEYNEIGYIRQVELKAPLLMEF